MAMLSLEKVSCRYDNREVVHAVDLSVDEGEVVCLLGPSGSGKSTLLRLIAGLETPQKGTIRVFDKMVAGEGVFVAPEQRGVGMVFQHPSLFPHLNVLDNVAFGLKGLSSHERHEIALAQLEAMDMNDFGFHYPHMLSGGEQQRVALARALAPKTRILLLDEPFANLDTVLRRKIRDKTLGLLRALGVATLFVTHDPEEALQSADRIYVLQHGLVEQEGTPESLYLAPKNSFVASFFGELNTMDVVVKDEAAETPFGSIDIGRVACENVGKDHCEPLADGTPARLYIRPEALVLAKKQKHSVEAVVEDVRFLGFANVCYVKLDEDTFMWLRVSREQLPIIGDKVYVTLDESQVFIFRDEAE